MPDTTDAILSDLAAEIAALPTFDHIDLWVNAINGPSGIRGKYMTRFANLAYEQSLSDQLRAIVGAEISRQCDHTIQLHAPIQDAHHGPAPGWSSYSIDLLTQAEKDSLT